MSRSIQEALEALPTSGVTLTVLQALDDVVPGEWENITEWNRMITVATGETDPDVVARIGVRAEALFQDETTHYRLALRAYESVDTVDKVVAAAALASKVGESFAVLSFLDRLTPKANTTQAIDAGLKFVAEVVAFGALHGRPELDDLSGFVEALGRAGKADSVRLAAWVVIDGVLPLGPDFMVTIAQTIGGLASGTLANNRLFASLADHLPGATADAKQNFIVRALGSATDTISAFVSARGLTQASVQSTLGAAVDVANNGLDILAAALDASTNTFAHTGTQTVARVVITDAYAQLKAQGDLYPPALFDEGDATIADEMAMYPDEAFAGDDTYEHEGPFVDGLGDDTYEHEGPFDEFGDDTFDDDGAELGLVRTWGADDEVDALLLDAMALAALADDYISEEEEQQLFALATQLPSLSAGAVDVEDALRQSLDRVRHQGFEAAMARIAQQLDASADRKEAFMLAATVLYSDGVVEEEEDDFIFDFGQALGLSRRRISRLLDSIESYTEYGHLDDSDEEDVGSFVDA